MTVFPDAAFESYSDTALELRNDGTCISTMADLPDKSQESRSSPSVNHRAGWEETTLLAECEVLHHRRRGPGGQHRNKVQTGVEIRHTPSGLVGQASERREQSRNHAIALFRLRVTLALELRCPVDPLAGPSDLWHSRVTERHAPPPGTRELRSSLHGDSRPQPARGIVKVNAAHHDYPTILAEAMDVVHACDYDIAQASAWLAVSPSQLIKFLATEPRALPRVNEQRALRKLHPIRS